MIWTKIALVVFILAISTNCSPVPDTAVDKVPETELTPVKGIVFQVPGNLCEPDKIFSPLCTDHCTNRGYTNGFCFSSKCTCN